MLPPVAAEAARDVDGIDCAAAGARMRRDRRKLRQLGKLGPHFVHEAVHGDGEEIFTAMVADVVDKAPLVGGPGYRVPLDCPERVRPHIIDQGRQKLAVVREKCEAWMRREKGPDALPELAPAAQA